MRYSIACGARATPGWPRSINCTSVPSGSVAARGRKVGEIVSMCLRRYVPTSRTIAIGGFVRADVVDGKHSLRQPRFFGYGRGDDEEERFGDRAAARRRRAARERSTAENVLPCVVRQKRCAPLSGIAARAHALRRVPRDLCERAFLAARERNFRFVLHRRDIVCRFATRRASSSGTKP